MAIFWQICGIITAAFINLPICCGLVWMFGKHTYQTFHQYYDPVPLCIYGTQTVLALAMVSLMIVFLIKEFGSLKYLLEVRARKRSFFIFFTPPLLKGRLGRVYYKPPLTPSLKRRGIFTLKHSSNTFPYSSTVTTWQFFPVSLRQLPVRPCHHLPGLNQQPSQHT